MGYGMLDLNPETLVQNPEPALKLELFHPSPVPQQNSEDSVGFLDSGRVSGSTGRQPLLSQDDLRVPKSSSRSDNRVFDFIGLHRVLKGFAGFR